MDRYSRDGRARRSITVLLAIVALLVFALAVHGIVRALAESPSETETVSEAGETPGFLPQETDPPEDPGETDGEPDPSGSPTEQPTATPAPDHAEDGTQYLHCRDGAAAEVSLNGAWNAEQKTLEYYNGYDGEETLNARLFSVPGTGYEGGEALLLEKTFYVDGFEAGTGSIYLKIGHAFYEPKLYVNGERVADGRFSYGDLVADVSYYVQNGANTLSVILKNGRDSVYGCGSFMGIDEDVVLSYGPGAYLHDISVLPDVDAGTVSFDVTIFDPLGVMNGEKLEINVFELGVFENGEAAIHNGAGTDAVIIRSEGNDAGTFRMLVRLRSFDERKLWTPDSPFLYEAIVRAGGLERTVIFGMRSAAVDESRYMTVNGSAVFLSGVTVDRAFLSETGITEDSAVAGFFEELKSFGINTVKAENMIFPSRWYDAADKAGVFLISEYCLGAEENAGKSASPFRHEILVIAQKLYNHPSHVIFDIAADKAAVPGIGSVAAEILASEYAVPVSAGVSEPASGNYVIGCDVSILGGETFLSDLPVEAPYINNLPEGVSWNIRTAEGAGIVTSLTGNILVDRNGNYLSEGSKAWWNAPENASSDYSRDTRVLKYYEVLKELLAYWRTSRKYAGIIVPLDAVKAGLSGTEAEGNRAGGIFRTEFKNALRDPFAEIGLNIESYKVEAVRGGRVAVDVAVTNNTPEDLGTVEVTFTLTSGTTVLYQETKQYDSLKKLGTPGRDIMRREYSFEMPRSIRDGTVVTLSAHLTVNGETVESSRFTEVSGGETYEDPYSQMIVTIVTASLAALIFGSVVIAFVMSRKYNNKIRKQASK